MGAEPLGLVERTDANLARNRAAVIWQYHRLRELVSSGAFAHPDLIGVELEGGAYGGPNLGPVPYGAAVIRGDQRGAHELHDSNWELGFEPVSRGVLGDLEAVIDGRLATMRDRAADLGCRLGMPGIPLTLTDEHLTRESMTESLRYSALDEFIVRMHRGRVPLLIDGPDPLARGYESVMPEAAGTALQVHEDFLPHQIPHAYNGAMLGAGVGLAACAGSPIFDGHRLWDETRIAVLEQVLGERCFFGDQWITDVMQLIDASLAFGPIILEQPNNEWLRELRMIMGTVWRWGRLCLFQGPDDARPNTNPTMTIEKRQLPTGPTPVDIVANIVWTVGVDRYCTQLMQKGLATRLDFAVAAGNFYAAAQRSHRANLHFPGFGDIEGRRLVLSLIEPVSATLIQSGVHPQVVNRYLAIIEERMIRRQTTADWIAQAHQILGAEKAMQQFLDNADSGEPAGSWEPVR